MSRLPATRVAWEEVFSDFEHLRMTREELAERIGLNSDLLQRVAAGKVMPTRGAADKIMWLWSHLTGKPLQFLPRAGGDGADQSDLPGPAEDEICEPECGELEAVIKNWHRAPRRDS